MASIDEIKQAGSKNEADESGTIVDPNLARKSRLAENAAKHGFKEVKDGKGQKAVDLVKDLGYKSDEEVAEQRMGADDITQALGDDLMAAAERKRKEMENFNETLEQCGGTMSHEDLVASEGVDFEAMMQNPPDPLNKDLVEYNRQQRERMMETGTPEELAAMGLTNEPVAKPTATATAQNVAPKEEESEVEEKSSEDLEDEELLGEMDTTEDETILRPITTEGEVDMDTTGGYAYPKDNIPIYTEEAATTGAADYTIPLKEEREEVIPEAPAIQEEAAEPEETFTIDAGDRVAEKAKGASIAELEGVNLDDELLELEREAQEEDSEESQAIYQKKLESARKDIRDKVIPIAQRIDIKGFAIANKPISITNSVDMAVQQQHINTARWALFSSKLPIEMRGFLGTEIDDLVRLSSIREPAASDNLKLYKMFYDHIVSPKPATCEEWLKTVSIMDIKHLYAAAYKASFDGMNFLPFDCTNPRCNNGFVSDSIQWDDMVKYEDDNARKEATKIYRSNPSEQDYKLYKTEIVPISDVYAMAFKEPSIFDVQIAPLYLDPEWYTKMEGTISINAYVDRIFVIDAQNRMLRPLNIKEFHGDARKTLKAKVLALGKVLTTLSSDQYNLISSYIEEINKTSNYVNYQYPEVICPKCGTKLPARDANAAELLFTRHRLTSLANG